MSLTDPEPILAAASPFFPKAKASKLLEFPSEVALDRSPNPPVASPCLVLAPDTLFLGVLFGSC